MIVMIIAKNLLISVTSFLRSKLTACRFCSTKFIVTFWIWNVNAHSRQILKAGVFTRDDNFMSFICGGAQTNSLETLWEVIKECIMSEQQQDAEILIDWDSSFNSCINLSILLGSVGKLILTWFWWQQALQNYKNISIIYQISLQCDDYSLSYWKIFQQCFSAYTLLYQRNVWFVNWLYQECRK